MFCILSLKQEGVGIFSKVNEQSILNLQVLFIPKGIKVILLKKQKHNKQTRKKSTTICYSSCKQLSKHLRPENEK